MSEMLRIEENFAIILPKFSESATQRVTEALLPAGGSVGPSLEVKFAAIHEGLTRNNTFYSKEGLTNKVKNDQGQVGGLSSWTAPYGAPILKNHDDQSVDNTLGRVIKAEWVEKAGSEPGHVELTASITNPEAIEKFIRGEYQTGSIGMDVDKACCSICNADFMKGWAARCEHERGKWYAKAPKGEGSEGATIEAEPHAKGARRMHIAIGNVWAREYSVVATPSDAKSKVKSFELKEMVLTEGEGDAATRFDMLKDATPAFTESVIDEPVISTVTYTAEQITNHFVGMIEADLLTFYFEVASWTAAGELNDHSFSMVLEDGTEHALSVNELNSVLTFIESTNEELEDELKALRGAVLSTENGELPDSAFALIKKAGDKKLRALPYRQGEGGTVDADALILALTRAMSIPTFLPAERAKAVKKLVAVAKKNKIATPESIEDRIAAAEAILANDNYKVITAEEAAKLLQPADETLIASLGELEEKVSTLEVDLASAQTLVIERETESDELLEQIADLKEMVTTAQTAQRVMMTEMILQLDGVTEDDQQATLAALDAMTVADLEAKLKILASTERILVTGRVGRSGLAGGGDDIDENAAAPVSTETVMAAHFGNKRAQRELSESVRPRK